MSSLLPVVSELPESVLAPHAMCPLPRRMLLGLTRKCHCQWVGSLDARASYVPEFCVGRMGIMFKGALRIIRRAI